MRGFPILAFSMLAFGAPAVAQERSFNFALGAGFGATPEYMGSDEMEGFATPAFKFGALRWGAVDVGSGIRGIPDNGFGLNGAFRILNERTSDTSSQLAGLRDIDIAIELGLGLKYQQTNWMAFGEVRKGVTGHDGLTGTLGADWIVRPNDRWLFTAGPRVNFGDDEFADTYFGIDTDEAAASSFTAYNATGGALSAGVLVTGTYFIDDKWALEGAISYVKLMGDAADSPITLAGSEDQWRIGFGLSRVFTLNF